MDSLLSDLGSALPSAEPDANDATFFRIDKGLDRRTLLEVYAEVVDGARTVLAPLGLPAVLKRHCPAPLLLERLRPTFDLLLDAASEAAYAQRGLTEASVAVAVHHWLEEAEDEAVRDALRNMQNALEEVVSLSDVVEVTPLPPPLPSSSSSSAESAAAQHEQGSGHVPTPVELVAEMRRLGAALAAVEGAYQEELHATGGGGDGSDQGRQAGAGGAGGGGESLVAALVGGPWPAGEKRRWMARLLEAVAPRGKAATVPWETGAALREVYAAANQSNSSEEEEGGMEGAHARCLAPVMLAGGDSLCAALRALEAAGEEGEGEEKAAAKPAKPAKDDNDESRSSSSSSSSSEDLAGLAAFHAFGEAVEDARKLAELHGDLEEAEERLRDGCDVLAPLVDAGAVPGSVLAWAKVQRAAYLKEAHELEGAMEALEAAIDADPQCGPAYLGRAQINRIWSQHAERRRQLKAKRKELERRARGEDADASGGSSSSSEGDSSDDEAGAEEAEILEDLERAYALDGLKTPAELQLLESALKEALRNAAMETLEERLAAAQAQAQQSGVVAGEQEQQQPLLLPPKWLAESYFASFHDSDLGEEVRPSAFNSTSPLAPLVTQARGLRRQREYAQAIALLRSVVRGKRAAAQGEGEEGENMGEAERGDLGWLENEWGSYCYLMGDLRGAEEAFARSLELDPGSINSMIKLGEVLSDLGRADEGLLLLDQAVQRTDMRNGDALLHRGQIKLTQEDIGGAVRDLRRAVHVDERPPPVAYACLGTALFKLDDTGASAQEALAEAAEKYPGSLEILLYHGDVLAQRGDLAGAMRRFQEAAHADPACPLPFVNAARAYLSVRDYPQAERHLAQALALDPACGASHLDMGQLHVQRGETGKAEAALAQALAQARYLPEILDALVFKRLAELQRRYHPVDPTGVAKGE